MPCMPTLHSRQLAAIAQHWSVISLLHMLSAAGQLAPACLATASTWLCRGGVSSRHIPSPKDFFREARRRCFDGCATLRRSAVPSSVFCWRAVLFALLWHCCCALCDVTLHCCTLGSGNSHCGEFSGKQAVKQLLGGCSRALDAEFCSCCSACSVSMWRHAVSDERRCCQRVCVQELTNDLA